MMFEPTHPGMEPGRKALEKARGLHGAGQLDSAEAIYQSLLNDPACRPDAHFLLGVARSQRNRHDEAANLLLQAIRDGGPKPEYCASLRSTLACLPASRALDFMVRFSDVLLQQRLYPEAQHLLRELLASHPRHVPAIINLAQAWEGMGKYRDGIACLLPLMEHYARRDEGIAQVMGVLEAALGELDLPSPAALAFDALPFPGQAAQVLNNFANCLQCLGYFAESEPLYQRAADLSPQHGLPRWNLAVTQLLLGELKRGWANYELRWTWKDFDFPNRMLPQPRFEGGELRGRRLLVYAEQGLGDTIQFCRLLPRLAEAGARVWFEVQNELFWLIRYTFRDMPAVEVIPRMRDPSQVYGSPEFDMHCSLMSLPHLLGIDHADLPAGCNYLGVEPAAVDHAASLFAGQPVLKVGLAWAGSPGHRRDGERSMDLATLAPLFNLPEARFFSLQVGPAQRQLQFGAPVVDLAAKIRDFYDTAAMLMHLDVVVTVDTAVAHLAGALGRPVILMLPRLPDWRWMLKRQDSPWYPRTRLVRQTEAGNWKGVVAEVRAQLLALSTTRQDMHGLPLPAQ